MIFLLVNSSLAAKDPLAGPAADAGMVKLPSSSTKSADDLHHAAMLTRSEASILGESALIDRETGRVFWEGERTAKRYTRRGFILVHILLKKFQIPTNVCYGESFLDDKRKRWFFKYTL